MKTLHRAGFHALIALACLAPWVAAENPSPARGFRLVWSDEFDRDGPPDPAKWGYENGFVRNQELQWYQPQNAVCSNGVLIIEGRRETRDNPLFDPQRRGWRHQRSKINYTSACITTRDKHHWQYGRFEVRAKIQARSGLWPAIWFLGRDGEWPYNGEVDLMEYYRGQILANAFWGAEERRTPAGDVHAKPLTAFEDPTWADRFHVWRMDWDEKRIALSVDGELLNEIDLSRTVNPDTPLGPKHPFRQPHYLLINLAIGGTAGGDPAATPFPAPYVIDYVRIYQVRD